MWCDPQAKVFTDDLKTQTEDIMGVKFCSAVNCYKFAQWKLTYTFGCYLNSYQTQIAFISYVWYFGYANAVKRVIHVLGAKSS